MSKDNKNTLPEPEKGKKPKQIVAAGAPGGPNTPGEKAKRKKAAAAARKALEKGIAEANKENKS